MNVRTLILAGALAAASTSLFAQEQRGFDCSQAKDPKACEERVSKMKAARAEAEKACQGKNGQERADCMGKQMCAQSKDPKACEERMTKMKDAHQDARKACQGKMGAEHEQCMAHETCAKTKDAAKCEA